MSRFVPLKEIRLDAEHTLEQVTGRFQTIKDGLPELVKNSKDQYARLGVEAEGARQIIIIFSNPPRHIAVLDFGGASAADFEGWSTWSSREAGRIELSASIEAGHGNGGKAFMVRGCLSQAHMTGHRDGKRTQMGFRNDDPKLRYRAGYFETDDGQIIRDMSDPRPLVVLASLLEPLGLSPSDLPPMAYDVLAERSAYTLVVAEDVNELVRARHKQAVVRQAVEDLETHPQAALTLETCSVWAMVGRKLIKDTPLALEWPGPMTGFEEDRVFQVPSTLNDPDTEETILVPKVSQAGRGELVLSSSSKHLRMAGKKALNVIRVRNERNILASWSVADLVPASPSAYLHGRLYCPALKPEHEVGADRSALAEVPLVRALHAWTADKIEAMVNEIRQSQAQKNGEAGKSEAAEALDELRKLMRDFLSDDSSSTAIGPGGDPPPSPRYGERVDEIVLENKSAGIAVPSGALIPLRYVCYEVEGDRRMPVRGVHLELLTEPDNMLSFESNGSIRALRDGVVQASLRDPITGTTSNPIQVTAWPIETLNVKTPQRFLKQGERIRIGIEACGRGASMRLDGLLYETGVDEPDMGRLTRSGSFIAGGFPGVATLRIRYGPKDADEETATVDIGEDRVERKPPQSGGADIPLILFCGDEAPGRDDLPPQYRTHEGGPIYPTIIDWDPIWSQEQPEIIWINTTSKEATKVRSGRSPGLIGLKSKTFYDFLVLKCFEVLRRLWVRQELTQEDQVTYNEFIQRISEAEMETADFLDAGFEAVAKLLDDQEGK